MRWRFRVWQVVPSVLAAAGLGLVTNLVTESPTVLLVVVFAVFAGVQVGLELWQGRRELAQARQVRDDVLALRSALCEEPTYLDRLTALYCPTPLWARTNELRGLVDWCLRLRTHQHRAARDPALGDPVQSQVRILAGVGGVGKSRLALAVAQELPSPWVAGWLRPGHDVIARIAACPEPALILVDDADRVAGLAELIAQAAAHQDQIRVLLICRNGQALRTTLLQELPAQLRPLLGADPVVLEPVGAGSDRVRWFEQAVRAYARALRLPPPSLPAPPVGDDRDTMLLLHARALLAVLGRGPTPRTLSDIAEALLSLEQGRWRINGPAPAQALTEVVLALTLLPAATAVEAAELLRRLPRYADAPTHLLTDLAEWARAEYPPQSDATLGLRPHLVAEWLLTSRLGQHPELLHQLSADSADATRGVFTPLARASRTFPEAAGLLAQATHGDPELLTIAVDCADTVGLTPALDRALADLIDPTNPAQVEALQTLVITTATSRLQARLEQVRVARLRTLAANNPDQYRSDLADSLTDLGKILRELGQPQQALPVDRESVRIYRSLAEESPHHYQRGLAHSLNSLGVTLQKLGRPQQALPALRESVRIRRGLTEEPSLRDRRDLARSLTNLGITLQELGRPQEALPIHRESVQICRRLAEESPYRYRRDLARSLTNLGITLQELGQPQEALPAHRESVQISQVLAEESPQRHRPDLARSLTNLGCTLQESGQPQQALPAHGESVQIHRSLVEKSPYRYRPNLARSLTNLGNTLRALGQLQEALSIHHESVQICRGLAKKSPQRHRPDLARSLTNLGVTLRALGQPREALPVYHESVQIYRRLVEELPHRYRPDLAHSLTNLGNTLIDLGQVPDGITARCEAVAILRECATSNPELHHSHYRPADADLRQLLDQLGDHHSAIALSSTSGTAVGHDREATS